MILGVLGTLALVAMGSAFGVGNVSLQDSSASVLQSFGTATSGATGSTSVTAQTTNPTTTGDLLVATIRTRVTTGAAATVTGVADSANQWVPATGSNFVQGAQSDAEIWYSANAASVNTVTVTVSTSAAIAVTVIDVSGAATVSPLDLTDAAGGTTATPGVGPTGSTSQANEIAIAAIGWNKSPTSVTLTGQTTGYTTTATEASTVTSLATSEQAAWQILGTTGPQSYGATLSAPVTWTDDIATFDLGTSSPTPTPSITASGTPTATPTPSATPTATPSPPPNAPHIMLIVDENKAYSATQGTPYIIGSPNAPYINSLASKYASATHWYANQHGSPDDYLDLISGSNQGLGSGSKPPYGATTLVDELNSAGISWKAYMEAMPSNCYTGGTEGLYEGDHNPFVYFNDYKSLCSGNNGVVPYTLPVISTDLNSSNPPDFVWVTPNICDDMHTSVSPCGSNAVVTGDTWLSNNLPTVLSSTWYKNGGIIIINWDESVSADTSGGTYGDGGQIAELVISANSKGSFTPSGDHYGTLRGIEEAYGVGLLGGSANASFGDIEPAFGLSTGSISGSVTDAQTTDALVGATVTCTCASGEATTGNGGAYSFNNVATGSGYSMTFSDTGYVTDTVSPVVVTSGKTTTESPALTEDGSITGEVTDSTTNDPISGAGVTCTCATGNFATGSRGLYNIPDVAPGTNYTMTFSAAGYGTQNVNSVAVTAGNPTNVSPALAEDGSLTGTVSNSSTTLPIKNAMVTCTCQAGSVQTNSSGIYNFTQAMPGSGYTVSVTAPGYTEATSPPFTITSGQETTQDVQLSPTTASLSVAQSFGAANSSSSTTLTATTGTPTGSGDLLVVSIKSRTSASATTITGITDNSSGLNKWTLVERTAPNGEADEEMWYSPDAVSITSITVTAKATGSLAMTVFDISGASSTPLDTAKTTNVGTGTAASTGTTPTTTQANEIIVADIGWNSTATLSQTTAGYTTSTSPPLEQQSTVKSLATGEQAAWLIVSATGTQSFSATLNASVAWTGVIAAFT